MGLAKNNKIMYWGFYVNIITNSGLQVCIKIIRINRCFLLFCQWQLAVFHIRQVYFNKNLIFF